MSRSRIPICPCGAVWWIPMQRAFLGSCPKWAAELNCACPEIERASCPPAVVGTMRGAVGYFAADAHSSTTTAGCGILHRIPFQGVGGSIRRVGSRLAGTRLVHGSGGIGDMV